VALFREAFFLGLVGELCADLVLFLSSFETFSLGFVILND
jgi:hypothetical protein